MSKINTFSQNPDKEGYFGKYGGRYIAETLMPLVLELEKSYEEAKKDKKFLSNEKFNEKLCRQAKPSLLCI